MSETEQNQLVKQLEDVEYANLIGSAALEQTRTERDVALVRVAELETMVTRIKQTVNHLGV